MYISANKNTYTPTVPLAEVLELQRKSTPDIFIDSIHTDWVIIKSLTNIVFSFSLVSTCIIFFIHYK